MVFGAEHGRNFKHPFVYGDKRLLVKLGALRKINRLSEIVKFKYVCAALSTGKINFGRVNLRKILALQIFAEAALYSFLQLKNSSFFRIAQSYGTVIEVYRKFAVYLFF